MNRYLAVAKNSAQRSNPKSLFNVSSTGWKKKQEKLRLDLKHFEVSAMDIVPRLDITQIFCDVDDFCQKFERHWQEVAQLPSMPGEKRCKSRMRLSEVMTTAIAFHGSGFRSFKEFYTLCVLPYWRKAFPNLVSYTRFVELMPWSLMLLCCFVHSRKGEVTGIAFIDSTPLEVGHPCRAHAHKVFKGLVKWGKNSVGWHFGFKLHLIINDKGELLAFKLTPANTDDRQPVPDRSALW